LRSHLHRTGLVRQLAGALPAGATVPADAQRQDVAERLGQWLNVADAIALSSAHQSLPSVGAAARPAGNAAASAALLRAEYERVRATLAKSITTRDASHRPDPDAPDAEFALYHQRYQDQQRRMEMSVDALRNHTRQTLAKTSPRLAQLAALDAALDGMLGGREQRLLHNVPAFLKARFKALRQQPPAAPGIHPFAAFAIEFEQTLLAELDHRLQPVVGMIEALDS